MVHELNYRFRSNWVVNAFEEIFDSFEDKVTRVRLEWRAPRFEIQPQVDYDPSYITRLEIPLITNTEFLKRAYKDSRE